ncbi:MULTISPECIES: hypothetical protein [unclassified Methylobacterium]|uniref:hypothetical protein n=1 Tax=unclassified Methylobacterium TaxID=2615210 RepID=UPI0006FDFD87|nr:MULTISPECIES: hypothetical protein [unclassified Methylobacterium]KQO59431.1 hypothetical protein ASF22_07195 [Methylobacterium sp. Leaf87]KQP20223.1 hypothetical protein ASF25_10035 [Methylobacterium sp. Leaf100]KQP60745.1 hypothetical protein ASF52_06320 [Methylobacterium sp. Leaf112]
MRFLGRVFVGCLALLLAIPCGAFVLGLGAMLDPVSRDVLGSLGLAGLFEGLNDLASGIGPETILFALAAFARALFLLLVLPPVALAVIGETLNWRSAAWYGAGTGLLTALVPWLARSAARAGDTQAFAQEGRITAILFLTGAASGLVYWLVAGRFGPRDGAV